MDRIWGVWGSYNGLGKAIFYLLDGDSRNRQGVGHQPVPAKPHSEHSERRIFSDALVVFANLCSVAVNKKLSSNSDTGDTHLGNLKQQNNLLAGHVAPL